MAYSLEGDFCYAVCAAWDDPADDARYTDWATDHLRSLESCRSASSSPTGTLLHRPRPFVIEDGLRRLDEVRAAYGPGELFVSWLGRPDAG